MSSHRLYGCEIVDDVHKKSLEYGKSPEISLSTADVSQFSTIFTSLSSIFCLSSWQILFQHLRKWMDRIWIFQTSWHIKFKAMTSIEARGRVEVKFHNLRWLFPLFETSSSSSCYGRDSIAEKERKEMARKIEWTSTVFFSTIQIPIAAKKGWKLDGKKQTLERMKMMTIGRASVGGKAKARKNGLMDWMNMQKKTLKSLTFQQLCYKILMYIPSMKLL